MSSFSCVFCHPNPHFSPSSPLGLQSCELSHFRLHSKSPIGLPFRATRSFGPNKSSSPPPPRLRVLCVRDTKAAVVTSESWDNLILKSDTPVLVEFYASWCGPCRMVHRVIDEIATDYSGRLKCFVLHADKDTRVAEEYDIKAVPVVLLFKHGEKHETIIGTMPKEFYMAAIDRVLGS